jgi:hypothetical protein
MNCELRVVNYPLSLPKIGCLRQGQKLFTQNSALKKNSSIKTQHSKKLLNQNSALKKLLNQNSDSKTHSKLKTKKNTPSSI